MSMNNRRVVSVALAAAALALIALAAVAGRASASPRAHQAARAQITVYAAASLTDVFPKIDPSQKYSFGGSNALASTDHPRRTGRRLRLGEPDAPEPALREGALLATGGVHP